MRIRIATPISHQFEDSEAGERLRLASDCLECRERSVKSLWPGQELFHFDVNLNHPWTDHVRRELADSLLPKAELRLATFQMASCCDAPVLVDGMFQPGGKHYEREEMLGHVRDNVKWLRALLPKDAELGIENNNHYPTEAYHHVTTGSFISSAVRDNGVRLLLDIAHAQVTAVNTGVPFVDYLSTLPMDRVIQFHICEPGTKPDGLAYDAHELPSPAMELEVERLARLWPVRYFTVEYYKDAVKLEGSLKRFAAIRARLQLERASSQA